MFVISERIYAHPVFSYDESVRLQAVLPNALASNGQKISR